MAKPTKWKETRRQAAADRAPIISLATCRVAAERRSEKSGGQGLRFIVEGACVLHGAAPPTIDIGGQQAAHMRVSSDRTVMVGLIPERPETTRVSIDHGFARGTCEIDSSGFTPQDAELFERLMTPPRVRKEPYRLYRKLLKFFFGRG